MGTQEKNPLSLPFHVDAITLQGGRDHQEDRWTVHTFDPPYEHLYLFVVCDGHGGHACSDFCIRSFPAAVADTLRRRRSPSPRLDTILKEAVATTVADWDTFCFGPGVHRTIVDEATRRDFFARTNMADYERDGKDSGCTLTGFMFDANTRRICIVNLGDSRTALFFPRSKRIVTSLDHGVQKTVEKGPFRAWVSEDGRLCDDLALARAVGDNTELLTGVVGREPDVYKETVPRNDTCTAVVASDGLWDNYTLAECFLEDRASAADFIADKHGEAAFDDNVTIILVKVPTAPPTTPTSSTT